MRPPIFSVVMPAYNAERFVKQSIESVLSQTLRNWELIVVDNASTDQTGNICKSFKDERIQVLYAPVNLQAAGARNLALEHARGEFMAFLDSDDLMADNRLERQWHFFQNNSDVGVCGSHMETFETTIHAGSLGTIKHPTSDGLLKSSMFFYDPFILSSLSIRASLLHGFSGEFFSKKFAPCEDYEFLGRLISKTKFANISEVLGWYRIHASQLSQTQKAAMRLQITQIWELLFEKVGINEIEIKLDLHESLVYQNEHPFERLVQLKSWLEALWNAGLKVDFLPASDWNKTMGFWWFVACQRARPLSLKCWWTYRRSPLAKLFLSRRQKLKFLKDCLLKKLIGC